jgi:hypothetical protein
MQFSLFYVCDAVQSKESKCAKGQSKKNLDKSQTKGSDLAAQHKEEAEVGSMVGHVSHSHVLCTVASIWAANS